ncbi:MAG: response regulator [Candidatus Margulisbacteria bacterium]|nr:response regulator [Candidatus Margulisiibacteriota bacterium]
MNQHILIVDDDKTFIDYLKSRLSALGYNVTTAGDGKEALEICKHEHPDFIVSDLCMPDVDGCDFAKQIKSDAKTKNIYFIMLSAFDNFVSIAKALDYGADDYVGKPCDFNILIGKIRNHKPAHS